MTSPQGPYGAFGPGQQPTGPYGPPPPIPAGYGAPQQYSPQQAHHAASVGAGVARAGTFHTLRTLRGPVRLVLRLLSVLFGLLTIIGVAMGISEGSWGYAIAMFAVCVVINAIRWWFDSAIQRTAPPGTTMIRPM